MKALAKYILIAALALTFVDTAAAEIRVFAAVDTQKDIYVGENFVYQVIIDGENTPGQVNTGALSKYKPQFASGRDVSQTSISIINGRSTTNIVKRYVFAYYLTVMEAGAFTLPAVTVDLNGTIYKTNEVVVNILQPGTTDKIEIEQKLSEKSCFAGQPLLYAINFYFFADVGQFRFNIPVFDSNNFYIEDPDLTGKAVQLFQLSSGLKVYVSQEKIVRRGREGSMLSFSKVLIPKNAGTFEIKPASVSADVVVGRSRNRDLFDSMFNSPEYNRFMVKSDSLTLEVKPLPQEGKPADFYGLVGRFTISAAARPAKVYVGEPITLTIRIGGEYLKPVQWPALEQIPKFSEDFKIPQDMASPVTDANGFKVFTQTIRANNDKVTQIPPIPLTYFDADKGKYVTIATAPIKLEVSSAGQAQVEGGGESGPVKKEVKAVLEGLAANYEGQDVLVNQEFSLLGAFLASGYTVIWGLPFAALIVSIVIKTFTTKNPERMAAKRRRGALKNAIGEIRKITSLESGQRGEVLAIVLKQYIGERFDKTAGSLTAVDCYNVIVDSTADAEAAEKYKRIIEDCEAVRYGAAELKLDSEMVKTVSQLLRLIDNKAKK